MFLDPPAPPTPQPYPDPEDDKGRGWLAGERSLQGSMPLYVTSADAHAAAGVGAKQVALREGQPVRLHAAALCGSPLTVVSYCLPHSNFMD